MPSPSEAPSICDFDLPALPNELLERIFVHLDLRTFKSVRLVCRRFKGLGELSLKQHIALSLSSPKQLSQLLANSKHLHFSHLKLSNFLGDVRSSFKNFERLSARVEVLRTLQVPHALLQAFLPRHSANLEQLCSLKYSSDLRDWDFPRLSSVKIFVDASEPGDNLEIFLSRCPRLRELELIFEDQELRPMGEECFECCVTRPILSYLEEVGGGRALSLRFTVPGPGPLPLRTPSLLNLLQHNVSIHNLPFLSLPIKRDLSPGTMQLLNDKVVTITATTQDLKVSTMEIEVDTFHSCRHYVPPTATFTLSLRSCNSYVSRIGELLPLKIDAIVIVTENTKAGLLNLSGEGSFAEELLTYRGDLKVLKLLKETEEKLEFYIQSLPLQLGNFPNLVVLHLDWWGRGEKDFWELYNLLQLEELVLRKCYKFSDQSLLGGGSIRRLEKLRVLVVEGCWNVGDPGLQVIAALGLVTLSITDNETAKVSRVGLRALGCADISNTLQYLKINKPPKCGIPELKQILTPARALKVLELVERGGASTKIHF